MDSVDSKFRDILKDYQFVQPFVVNDLDDCPYVENPEGLKLQIKLNGVDEPTLIPTFKFADINISNRNDFAKVSLNLKESKHIVYIKVSDFSAAVRFDPEKVDIQAKAGNLGFFLNTIKSMIYREGWVEQLSDRLEIHVLQLGSKRTGICIEILDDIMRWCKSNREKIQTDLRLTQSYYDDRPYVLYKAEVTGLIFSIEVRGHDDITVRYKKNCAEGSLSILSRGLCLKTGRRIVKLKRFIVKDHTRVKRVLHSEFFANELNILKRVVDLANVVQCVRKPELLKKYRKIPCSGRKIDMLTGLLKTHTLREEWRIFLYFEDLEGDTLYARLIEKPHLELSQSISIGRDIGNALEGIHKAGVLHADLKDNNVILTPNGAVVLDFDLAALLTNCQSVFSGFPLWCPPEFVYNQLLKEKIKKQNEIKKENQVDPLDVNKEPQPMPERFTINESFDVYTFGVLFFQILTNKYAAIPRLIFNNQGYGFIDGYYKYRSEYLRATQLSEDYTTLRNFKIPEYLIILVLSCMHPIPSQRPTMQKINEGLNKITVP
jgi:serine/threonine protein kinase